MTLDYLAAVRENSARFLAVLRDAPADAQVPSCPEWRTDDLLWHLAEVQHFWGRVLREDPQDPESLDAPARPGDRAGLLAFFEQSTQDLQAGLADVDPGTPRWTWSEDRTAGFIRRRQAHEALVHRIDAELTADIARAPVDPHLAADGVDEALRVMYGGCPPWATLETDPATSVRIRATDAGHSWVVTAATFSGTSPAGNVYDHEPTIEVADSDDDSDVAATVEGEAADLDCWLWGRPTIGEVERDGADHALARLQEAIAAGIE